MNTRTRARTAAGFTLIEVILAIAILAVMVTLNYQLLRGIIKAKELIEDRRDAMYIANSLIARLSRELQLAINSPQHRLFDCPDGPAAGPPPANPGAPRFLLAKSDDGAATIQFMAKGAGQQTADSTGQTGVVMLRYSVVEDPDRRSERGAPRILHRSETPSSGQSPSGANQILKDCKKEINFPISTSLDAFSLRFYDRQTKQWSAEWDQQRAARLPNIIEFTVTLRSPMGNQITHTSAARVTSAP
jgi:prepilin-type N-terminal cleavage/methylation domain-containing protein